MEKTLILPDIHCNYTWAEVIIDKEKPDKTIFLGDYFDRFDADPNITEQVAKWLRKSSEKEDRVHLIGNHELYYVSGNPLMICSGNTSWKRQIINEALIDWSKFRIHYWLDDWLLTHAGFTKSFYETYNIRSQDVKHFIETVCTTSMINLIHGHYTELFAVSEFRGGNSEISGPLWCDLREFERIDGLKQLFGHTHHEKPYISEDGQTIDLDADGCYAIYEDKEMKVIVP